MASFAHLSASNAISCSFFSSLSLIREPFTPTILSFSTQRPFLELRSHPRHSLAGATQAAQIRVTHVAASAKTEAGIRPHTTSFENISTEEELIAGIHAEVEAKRLPAMAAPGMEKFFFNYRNALVRNNVPTAEEVAVTVMASVFDRIMVQFEDPFTFPSYHTRMTGPYNYYDFGQNYVRPLIDFRNSYMGNEAIFTQIDRQLAEGHNVVLLANHQTEADPGVLALLLETSHPRLATDVTYIAGDRVVLDPFCKPFSMGRNLLCVFSKKRINDVPELADQKMAANRRTLMEMSRLFRKGGNLIWVAPSGGRDRPDPVSDEWVPAAFDPASVEMMRRMLEDAGPSGHLYPMALLCYDIMPPPRKVEKELGEERIIDHHGVGISVAAELEFSKIAGHIDSRKEAREVYSEAVFAEVNKQYAVLKDAIHGGKGVEAATPICSLSQPWAASNVNSQPEVSPTPASASL